MNSHIIYAMLILMKKKWTPNQRKQTIKKIARNNVS